MIVKYYHSFYIFAATLIVVLIGCAGEPYVLVTNEFNRESDIYVNGIRNRNKVEICYNKQNASPQQVIGLALAECRNFGKRAKFSKTTYTTCPLRTPVAAVYDCYEPDKRRRRLTGKTGR